MNDKLKSTIAIAICVTAAGVGTYLITRGVSRAWTVFDIACVWYVTADWLGKRLWLLRMSFGGIKDQAQRGRLRLTGLARAISLGALALWGVAAVLAFA